MTQYSNALARRTGTAAVRSSPTGFFEDMKQIPARLFSERARTPVMFGALGSHCYSGWYGNEPEAKMSGGGNMQSNLFGFGSAHEDIEYLGGFTGSNMTGIALGIAALYFLTR